MNDRDDFPADRRKEERELKYAPIKFISVEKGDEIVEGVIMNVSEGGMTIFSDIPLHEGEKVKVISPFHMPHHNFVVQWVNKYLNDFFHVGLKNV